MTEEIYGDVLFLVNFSMDFLSLFLAGKLLHDPLRAWRVIAAASLGAVYGVSSLFFDFGAVWNGIVTLAVTMLMAAIAYDVPSLRIFIGKTVLFAGIGMLLGGMMTAAFTKLSRYRTVLSIDGALHTVYGDLPLWLFALLAALSALFTWLVGAILGRRRKSRTCEVLLTFDGTETRLSALSDSGNLVAEPISGTPVLFVKESHAAFLPAALSDAMKSGVSALDERTARRLRFVPISTVAGERLLVAAVPEKCLIRAGRGFEAKKALVAIDCTAGDFDGFPALVPEALL